MDGLRVVPAIAWQTFTEARRNKIFYSLFFFALVVVLNSILFTEVTIVTMDRVLKDTGMAAINVFALVLTIFTGVGVINREIDRRSVYAVITKPIPRYSFILGKYLGLLLISLATSGLMLVGLVLVMAFYKTPITSTIFIGYLGIVAEMALLGAFAVLCSSFTSSIVSAFCTIALFVCGHISYELLHYANKSASLAYKYFGRALYYLVPNLERFNFKTNVTYDLPVGGETLGLMSGYAVAYIAAFLIGAVVVFSNRDFR